MTPPLVIPAGVKVQGSLNVKWVTTMALGGTAASLAEINAASSKEIADFLTTWAPGINQNKGNPPRRIGSTVQFEQFGNVTYSLGDLSYMYTPQGAALSAGLKAWEALTPGLSGYFVERQGIDSATAFAIGQFVSVWPVTLGQRLPAGDPTDEFAEYMVTQPVIVPSNRTERIAIVA